MTKLSRTEIEPAGGVALWRQIADTIRLDIIGGKLESGDKLEGELPLAERFGVNRHTVRRAIAVLVEEGVLRAEHGRGTFVAEARRLSYPIDPTLTSDMAAELLEPTTQSAVQSTFARLSGLSTVSSSVTIEDMMREMLRPMLKEWLDENLPTVVERIVEQEIARVSRGNR